MREEWRTEEEHWTAAAATQWAHGRTLVDIATEVMHRGDTVQALVGPSSFVGRVTYVGRDYLQLNAPGGQVDIRLVLPSAAGANAIGAPLALHIVERARAGGERPAPGADTFRARLLERETGGAPVLIGAALLRDTLRGELVVGRDQLMIRGAEGEETYLPLAWISWVMTADDGA